MTLNNKLFSEPRA